MGRGWSASAARFATGWRTYAASSRPAPPAPSRRDPPWPKMHTPGRQTRARRGCSGNDSTAGTSAPRRSSTRMATRCRLAGCARSVARRGSRGRAGTASPPIGGRRWRHDRRHSQRASWRAAPDPRAGVHRGEVLGERAHRARRPERSVPGRHPGEAPGRSMACHARRAPRTRQPQDPPPRACTTCSCPARPRSRMARHTEHRGRLDLAGHARGQGGALARLHPVRSDHRRAQRRAGDQRRASRSHALPPQPWISVGLDVEVPDAVDLEPCVYVDRFRVDQPYRLVFFGEKTSLEEILTPIARECSADLYLPAGEISDTMLHQMAAGRRRRWPPDGGACASRDCDPSGWQMPISIGRKLQAFKALLFPDLAVPGAPGRAHSRAGPGAWLAINAAEGDRAPGRPVAERRWASRRPRSTRSPPCNPPCCAGWPAQAIAPFFDPTLTSRCNAAQSEWRDACQEAVDEQTDQEHLDAIAAQANEVLETVREQIKALEEQIRIDPRDYELPAAARPARAGDHRRA